MRKCYYAPDALTESAIVDISKGIFIKIVVFLGICLQMCTVIWILMDYMKD
jgi:hypothetical protein